MGLSDEVALSSLRISLGRKTTIADIEFAAEEIKNTVHQLKKAVV
jgi:cysteine desulfurase